MPDGRDASALLGLRSVRNLIAAQTCAMIYLRFAVTRSTADNASSALSADEPAQATAEFMFQSEDARESTRWAVGVLKEEGWRALEINDAWEGHSAEDFVSSGEDRSIALYHAAESDNAAHRILIADAPVEAMQQQLSFAV